MTEPDSISSLDRAVVTAKLAQLVSDSPDDETKDVLAVFDPQVDTHVVKDGLGKFTLPILKKVARFLNEDSPVILNKNELIDWIINRVTNLFPKECGICTAKYNTCLKSPLCCVLCKRNIHSDCYQALVGSTDPLPDIKGLYWFCPKCEGNITVSQVSDTHDEPVSTQDAESAEIVVQDDVPEPDTVRNNNDQIDNMNSNNTESRNNIICKFYKNNRCKHGLSGSGCRFHHPKPCKKFLQNGNDPRLGCKKGASCGFFHPKMCNNSINTRECLNENCAYMHLKGTKRTKTPQAPKFNITSYQQDFPPLPSMPNQHNPMANHNLQHVQQHTGYNSDTCR